MSIPVARTVSAPAGALVPVVAADRSAAVKSAALAAGGYVCDGVDDDVEIQAALDALTAITKPSLVKYASGTVRLIGQKFVIGNQIRGYSGIELCGDGSQATTLIPKLTYAAANMVALNSVNVERFRLRCLALDGRKADGISCGGWMFDNTAGVFTVGPDPLHFVEDVWVHDCALTGAWLGVNCRGSKVINLDVSACGQHGFYCPATDCKIMLVRTSSCGTDDGLMAYYGIGIKGSNNQILNFKANFQRGHNVWVDGTVCYLEGQTQDAWGAGLYLSANTSLVVADIVADSCAMFPQGGVTGSDANIYDNGTRNIVRGTTRDRGFAEGQVDVGGNVGNRTAYGLRVGSGANKMTYALAAKNLRTNSIVGTRTGIQASVMMTDDIAVSDVQIVTLKNATGGTFTLTDVQSGQTTGAITFSTTAATLQANAQTALQALAALGANVTVNSASFPYQFKIVMGGTLANQFRSAFTLNGASLTGTSVAATINHAIEGGARTSEALIENSPLSTGGTVYPETYGAVGDGVSDDTSALQTTFNAAGTKAVVLKGAYRCTGQLLLPAGLDLRLATAASKLIKDYSTGTGGPQSFLLSNWNLITRNGTTATSVTVTGLSQTSDLTAGMSVAGAGIVSGTKIQSVDSSSQVTLTLAAAASATVQLAFTTKTNNIRITGPGSIYATSTAMNGNLIRVFGDDFVCQDFRITCWGLGNAISGVGDRWRFTNLKMTGGLQLINSGGLRYLGGDSSVFHGLHIESGDDSLQMVTAGNVTDPHFDQSITRCTYSECTGGSAAARFIAVILRAAAGPGGMTGSIKDCEYLACRGYANTRAIFILNRDSTGDIDNVTLQDSSVDTANSAAIVVAGCSITNASAVVTNLDTSLVSTGLVVTGTGIPVATTILSIDTGNQITLSANATATNANVALTFGGYNQSVLINRSSGTTNGVLYYSGVGKLRNIYLRRLNVLNPAGTKSTVTTAGVGLENIFIDTPTLSASPNATATSVIVYNSTTTAKVRGGMIDCGGNAGVDGVVVGGTSLGCADVVVEDTRVVGITNGHFALNFNVCAAGSASSVRAEQFSGQTTAKAARIAATSSGITIWRNDWSQLSNSSKITDLASDTVVGSNLGDTSAYGGFFAGIALSGGVGGPAKFVRRTTDSATITANTTPANDDTLTLAVGVSDVWMIEVFLVVTGANTTHDIKVGLATPAGATGYWGAINNSGNNVIAWGPTTAAQTPLGVNTTFGAIAAGTFAGLSYASFMGIVAMGGTSGNITVQWAQATSDAGALGLKAQSYMRCTRLA